MDPEHYTVKHSEMDGRMESYGTMLKVIGDPESPRRLPSSTDSDDSDIYSNSGSVKSQSNVNVELMDFERGSKQNLEIGFVGKSGRSLTKKMPKMLERLLPRRSTLGDEDEVRRRAKREGVGACLCLAMLMWILSSLSLFLGRLRPRLSLCIRAA